MLNFHKSRITAEDIIGLAATIFGIIGLISSFIGIRVIYVITGLHSFLTDLKIYIDFLWTADVGLILGISGAILAASRAFFTEKNMAASIGLIVAVLAIIVSIYLHII